MEEDIATSKAHVRTRTFSPRPYGHTPYCAFTFVFASGIIPKISYLHREDWRKKQEIDLDQEQLTTITQKERNMSQARGDSMLNLTANRETLIHKASEQAEFARTVEIGQYWITNVSVMDGHSSTLFFAEKTQSLGMIDTQDHKQLINDHAKIGPVTELEVFEFARAEVLEVHVPSRQPGNAKSKVHNEEWHSTHDNLFSKILSTKVLDPCFRLSLRAAGDCEHRRKVNSHR